MSWEDEISKAEAGIPRAQVMLTRAQNRNSKSLIAEGIRYALREVGADMTITDLLDLYGLPFSAQGLTTCAEHLAKDLADPDTRRDYLGL